jgi:sugar phosphate permease
MAGFLLGAMGMFGVGPSAGRLGDLADALAGYVPGLVWQHWGWPGVVAVTLTALGIAVAVSLPGLGRRSAPLPRRVTPASSAEPPA